MNIVMPYSSANLLDYVLCVACSEKIVEMHWLVYVFLNYVLHVARSQVSDQSRLKKATMTVYHVTQRSSDV